MGGGLSVDGDEAHDVGDGRIKWEVDDSNLIGGDIDDRLHNATCQEVNAGPFLADLRQHAVSAGGDLLSVVEAIRFG